MKGERIERIVLAGTGKAATATGLALRDAGLKVVRVAGRTPARVQALAKRLGAKPAGLVNLETRDADLCILAVSDAALTELAAFLRLPGTLVAHTSGTAPMSVLEPVSGRTGVFYPLQTFPAGRRTSFRSVPMCIEAARPEDAERLTELAGRISSRVRLLDSEQRRVAHLGAVLVSNFSNYLYARAEDLLAGQGLSMEILEPLIRKTASNVRTPGIFSRQTGPAVRHDFETLERHRQMLADRPDLEELYTLLSEHIMKYHDTDGKL